MDRSTDIVYRSGWKHSWQCSVQRSQMVVGTVIMLFISCALPTFFHVIEKRKGIILNDWLLEHIPPHNVSVIIFILIWGILGLVFVRLLKTPTIYITYIWVLIFICVARVITISLIPLSPPIGLIPLTDPITGIFYGESDITHDLFFSGHTSTVYLAYLCLERKGDKTIALIATVIVMCLLLVQHVHYTIDIIAAPIFVYPLYRMVKFLLSENTVK